MVQERKGEELSVSLDVGDAQTLQKGQDTRLQMGAGPGSLCGVHTILLMMVSRGPKLPGRRSEAMSSRLNKPGRVFTPGGMSEEPTELGDEVSGNGFRQPPPGALRAGKGFTRSSPVFRRNDRSWMRRKRLNKEVL